MCKEQINNMDSTDYRVTALLTEHFEFSPLSLIDDVINAVNKIMYNCTDALDAYLEKRRNVQLEELRKAGGDDGTVFPLAEIRQGTAELETLLVSHVDRYFDKFELYTLRNILVLPKDLVEDGWVRLKHHEGLDLAKGAPEMAQLEQVGPLVESINLELKLRKLLKVQTEQATRIVRLLRHYKRCVELTVLPRADSRLDAATVAKLRDTLEPMNENIYFLLGQVDELLRLVLALNDKFMNDKLLGALGKLLFAPTNRDAYIRDKSMRILDEIGVWGDTESGVLYSAYAETNE